MSLLNQSAFLKALGWSLLDSLWQMGLLWLVYVVLTANGKKYQSRQRHSIALLSLAGGSLWFFITLVIHLYKTVSTPEVITVYISNNDLVQTQSSFAGQLFAWLEPALPFLSVAYLFVIAFLFLRFYRQYRSTQRLFTDGIQKAHPEWRAFLQQAVEHMGIKKNVRIWMSSIIDTPLTLGFWKPVILLPLAAVNHLSIQQAEAIILHELNHIRRNDYLVNLLIACADILLFFNPFAHLLTGTIRKERENSCDDMVLQFRYDARLYAKALLELEKNRIPDNCTFALPATGKSKQLLLNRVKRILTNEPVITPLNHKLIAYLFSAVLVGFIGFYNPGNVIVKTIRQIQKQEIASNGEAPLTFSTPPAGTVTSGNKQSGKTVTKEKGKNNHEQTRHKLEQLIELTTDAKLAVLSKKALKLSINYTPQLINVVNEEVADYSMPEAVVATPPPAALAAYPFVPSSSFSYQILEDTALPKKYIMTYNEQQAKENMDKAMKGLKQINWQKLEKDLKSSGKKIDAALLQKEIQKAMQDIDWNKVSEDSKDAMEDAGAEITQLQNGYVVQLGNYQRERTDRQTRIKEAQQKILVDRLQQHEQLKKMENKSVSGCPLNTPSANKSKTPAPKVKKIIHI